MPFINLGNIKTTLAGGGTLYTHTYDLGTKTHEFNGLGALGFCKCTASYKTGDIIKLNGVEISAINLPHYIINGVYILFMAEESAMLIFNKAEYTSIPDGTIAPPDDVATWCACAGLDYAQLGQPDIQTLATSTEYSTALFNNDNAFKYFQRSQTLIKDGLIGTNAINLLDGRSDLYKTPVMADINSPAGYSADSNFPIYNNTSKYPIFGGQIRIKGTPTASDYYAQLFLPEPIWPYKMTYRPNSSGAGSPNDLVIKWQASNDGQSWVDLDQLTCPRSAETQYTWYNKAGETNKYSIFRMYYLSGSGRATEDAWFTGYLNFYGFK